MLKDAGRSRGARPPPQALRRAAPRTVSNAQRWLLLLLLLCLACWNLMLPHSPASASLPTLALPAPPCLQRAVTRVLQTVVSPSDAHAAVLGSQCLDGCGYWLSDAADSAASNGASGTRAIEACAAGAAGGHGSGRAAAEAAAGSAAAQSCCACAWESAWAAEPGMERWRAAHPILRLQLPRVERCVRIAAAAARCPPSLLAVDRHCAAINVI